MTRIIGDRTGKSALDEMEEVARARNKDVAEEERLEVLRKAKGEERAKAPSVIERPSQKQVIIENSPIMPASIRSLEFENVLPRYEGSFNKLAYHFDESLERLRKEGYERHALPAEAFSLICDGLEGKLTGNLEAALKDMLRGGAEWVSMAWERRKDKLIVYEHPEGLAWDEKIQDFRRDNFSYSAAREFKVGKREGGHYFPLKLYGDELSLYLYSREFAKLPEEIRKGCEKLEKAKIALPWDCKIQPVIRSYFFINPCNGTYASRGVRAI